MLCFWWQFVQWNIHRCGVKQSEYSLSQDAVGPFVLSGYSGYKQVQVPRGRLFAFDSEGQHVLTCSSTGGIIYRVNTHIPTITPVIQRWLDIWTDHLSFICIISMWCVLNDDLCVVFSWVNQMLVWKVFCLSGVIKRRWWRWTGARRWTAARVSPLLWTARLKSTRCWLRSPDLRTP